jgi:hypothetical protein
MLAFIADLIRKKKSVILKNPYKGTFAPSIRQVQIYDGHRTIPELSYQVQDSHPR